jgi:hypothetical protein
MRRTGFASTLALGLLASVSAPPGLAPPAVTEGAPRRASKARGKGSINHAARAARSHAGKPAGYVKAY